MGLHRDPRAGEVEGRGWRWRDEEGCGPTLPATSSQILQMCLGSCLGTEVAEQLGSALRFSMQSSENPVF